MTDQTNQNNAYLAAISNVNEVLAFMTSTATNFIGQTQGVLNALEAWQPPPEGTPPNIQPTPVTAKPLPPLPKPDPNLLGTVGSLNSPDWQDLSGMVSGFTLQDPGPFVPAVAIPPLPAPPAPIDTSGAPALPALGTVAIPTSPDLSLPALDPLSPITIPALPNIVIPTLNIASIPTFNTPPPNLTWNWTELAYSPQVLNETAATIKAMLQGNFAMPMVVQDALFGAGDDREQQTARAQIEEAYDDFAARGFFMPPGMLAEQVNAVREKSQLQANTLSREIMSKAAQWSIENLRTAVAQGIALEHMWSEHWNQTAQRVFDAAKEVVEIAKDQFNLTAEAFNLQIKTIQVQREVFEAQLRAELAQLDIFKGELEGQQLVGQLNEQKVRIYTGRLQAVETAAKVFASQLQAAELQYNVAVKGPMDLYRTQVEAWGEKIKADKTRFDAYDSLARGVDAAARAYEADARAYAATVQGYSARNEASLGVVKAKLEALDIGTKKFLGLLQASVAQIAANRDAIAARAQGWSADLNYYGEQLKYQTASQDVSVRAQEATVRNNMAYFETISRQFDARMSRLLAASNAIKDALTAAGHMASQMAAGAMSSIHAASDLRAGGDVNTAYDYHYSYNMTPNAPPAE